LRSQIDASSGHTNEATRGLEKDLDRSLFENARLLERVKELEQRMLVSSSLGLGSGLWLYLYLSILVVS